MGKPSWLATGREVAGKVLEHDEDSGAAILARALFTRHHTPETMLGIYKLVEEMAEALDHVQHFCICDRDVKGFDYSEEHKYMGKPGSGKRWRTPCDVAEPALAAYHAGPKKGGGG